VFSPSKDAEEQRLLTRTVQTALVKHAWGDWQTPETGDTVLHDVLLILPDETIDEATGAVALRRAIPRVTFRSAHIAKAATKWIRLSPERYRDRWPGSSTSPR
jgi:hypothetical protein